MAARDILHLTKINDFMTWLDKRGIDFRGGVGPFQVLQVKTPRNGWQPIYQRDSAKEHYTVTDKLLPLVRQFIAQSKEA